MYACYSRARLKGVRSMDRVHEGNLWVRWVAVGVGVGELIREGVGRSRPTRDHDHRKRIGNDSLTFGLVPFGILYGLYRIWTSFLFFDDEKYINKTTKKEKAEIELGPLCSWGRRRRKVLSAVIPKPG